MDRLKGSESGFLLLTSKLGDPGRKPLSAARFRELTNRVRSLRHQDPSLDLEQKDLISIGYSPDMARHILELLQDGPLLDWYLSRARKYGIVPLTRATDRYPLLLRRRLGQDAPGCLWARGDLELLKKPAIALVGSRDLREENRVFAQTVGVQAAKQGLVLVSGNARGADQAAQNACLQSGGQVISIVADALLNHVPGENMLYLSELGYDEPFSPQRALSRNRCIHALGRMVFVAQCSLNKGGTWDGTVKNLRNGYSSVACFRDGSEAARELEQLGAFLVEQRDLMDLGSMTQPDLNFFDGICSGGGSG